MAADDFSALRAALDDDYKEHPSRGRARPEDFEDNWLPAPARYFAACDRDVIRRLLDAADERDRLREAIIERDCSVTDMYDDREDMRAERDAERARAERAEKEAELQARATEDWHARWQRACDRLAEESARAERLAAALREVDMDLTCRDDDDAHYCPNCDRSLFRLRMYIRAALAAEPGVKP